MTDLTLRLDQADLTVTVPTARPRAVGASRGASGRVGPAGVDIARYAFDPGGPMSEGPKPFLHPLRTLDGALLTGFRPWDHRWHKGLQMTWTYVSGQNFWGGNTFRPEHGDYALLDNVGSIRHDRFTSVIDAGPEVSFTEDLTWITQGGDGWLAETRTHRFHGVDADRGLWMLDFSTTLRNVSGRRLELGSPTTEGRPGAGYTGFMIRMPRSWTGGRVLAGGLPDDAGDDGVMGRVAPWVAFSGEHDEVDGGATILAFAGSSTGAPPIRWFVRSEPTPVLAPSPSFDEYVVLAPGDELSLTHRHVFGDRVWTPSETRALAEELAP